MNPVTRAFQDEFEFEPVRFEISDRDAAAAGFDAVFDDGETEAGAAGFARAGDVGRKWIEELAE